MRLRDWVILSGTANRPLTEKICERLGKPLGQIDDIMQEIQARTAVKERVMIVTLTIKMAEDLTAYLKQNGIKDIRKREELHFSRNINMIFWKKEKRKRKKEKRKT
jgi:hypothetical protein